MTEYLADVQRYDGGADEAVVSKIVKHLGIALRNRDSALVSASDLTELDRAKEKRWAKKLAVAGADADAAVAKTMAGNRSKSRVTFYCLVAKHLGQARRGLIMLAWGKPAFTGWFAADLRLIPGIDPMGSYHRCLV